MDNVFISGETQYSLLYRGLEIVKQCVWDFLDSRKHRATFMYPWGRGTVRLGRTELQKKFGEHPNSERLQRTWGYRQNSPEFIHQLLYEIVDLRNAASHFDGAVTVGRIETHLKAVRRLTIQLYDEQHALVARGLRDALRGAAEATVGEVAAKEPLGLLPFAAYPWKHHHEQTFESARRNCTYKEYPHVMFRAARDWDVRMRPQQCPEVAEGSLPSLEEGE